MPDELKVRVTETISGRELWGALHPQADQVIYKAGETLTVYVYRHGEPRLQAGYSGSQRNSRLWLPTKKLTWA